MSWLVDTNVLLRLADEQSQEHSVAEGAVARLLARGIRQLLTFNTADFPASWGVDAVHPEQLVLRT